MNQVWIGEVLCENLDTVECVLHDKTNPDQPREFAEFYKRDFPTAKEGMIFECKATLTFTILESPPLSKEEKHLISREVRNLVDRGVI